MSETTQTSLKYRADIDGLRAVAVLLVLACHFKVRRSSGGFVGVDVFFVISGYLISSIILSQIAASRFSIVSFYERRIRRIFPALLVMVLGTAVLAYLFSLPTELEDFAKSVLAATFSVANLYFWKQSGYFDTPAATKPLLHTWSLGVEEQFYIFFPIFLLLVRRFFPSRLRTAVLSLAALSLAASVAGAYTHPVSTFYLAHTRAWELLLGTILSMRILPEMKRRPTREVAAAVGLAMIAFAALTYSAATPFPGLAAIPPCFGAALIIAAGQSGQSTIGKLLSLRPVVFIGTISYSLYLWHWPIVVYQSVGGILGGGGPGHTPKILGISASLVAGYLSWRFVEVPFRNGRLKFSGPVLFRVAAAGAAGVAAVALAVLFTHGFRSRFSPEAVRIASYLQYQSPYREGTCFITSRETYEDFSTSTCLHQDAKRQNYLLIGDSHAAQLWYGLSTVFNGVNVMQATASGCKPVIDTSGDSRCTRLIDYVYSDYLATHHIDKLLLAARWEDMDPPAIARTVAWARSHGIPVVLFGPIVAYDTALPRLLIASMIRRDPAFPFNHRVMSEAQLDRQMESVARKDWGVEYVSYFDTLCRRDSCIEYANNGVPLQSDASHLTKEGSVLVAEKLGQDRLLP